MSDCSDDSDIENVDPVPTKLIHPIHKYYRFDPNCKRSKCLTDGCAASVAGKNVTNLVNHLKQKAGVHFRLQHYAEYLQRKKVFDEEIEKRNSQVAKAVKRKKDQLDSQAAKQTKITDVSILFVITALQNFIASY